MPNRRWQRRATRSGVSASAPSGSGKITKSLPVPWPFVNLIWGFPPRVGSANCTSALFRSGQGIRHECVRRPVQPPDRRIPPEPGSLPPDEPPGAADRLVLRLGLAHRAVDLGERLLVAERATGRPAVPEAGQRAHLVA